METKLETLDIFELSSHFKIGISIYPDKNLLLLWLYTRKETNKAWINLQYRILFSNIYIYI